ncbi:MAG: hypothetical protein KAT71_02290 [Gammaproteobacteria bacterium]|nr:hypothetical protein [Gammaproteobacteria bacterium]
MINQTPTTNNTVNPAIDIKHGEAMLQAVAQDLRERIIANDADAFMQTGVTALHCNKIGFAWVFIKAAAKYKHALAAECLTFLNDDQASVPNRIKSCLKYLEIKKWPEC